MHALNWLQASNGLHARKIIFLRIMRRSLQAWVGYKLRKASDGMKVSRMGFMVARSEPVAGFECKAKENNEM